jgi:hypothetical protein
MKLTNGTLLILGTAAILAVSWFGYRTLIPPRWLHDFAADIALHGAPDPSAPPPEDIRQATPRGLTRDPYICFRRDARFAWDRLVVVPSYGDPVDDADLRGLTWPRPADPSNFANEMKSDPRYQLIVLIKDDHVVAHALFYTFWGDLTALARPGGFSPETAVFTAVVKNGTYLLSVVPPPTPAVCAGSVAP